MNGMGQNKHPNCPCAPCAGRCCPMMCSNAIHEALNEENARETLAETYLEVSKVVDIIRHYFLTGQFCNRPLHEVYRHLFILKNQLKKKGGAL